MPPLHRAEINILERDGQRDGQTDRQPRVRLVERIIRRKNGHGWMKDGWMDRGKVTPSP